MTFLQDCKRSVMRKLKPASMVQSRSTRPASETWGYDRGRPIDRYYIDRFFASFGGDMRGDLLEIQEPLYSGRHGRDLRSRHILDIDPGNEAATLVADLGAADSIEANRFDCFVLPQTLQYTFDVRAALSHAHRILRPGGILLATVPALSRVDSGLYTSDYWRFTPASCERLLQEQFGEGDVMIATFGNALSCGAFIQGLSVEEFSSSELDPTDSHFPLILGIRARKAM
jgi:SAM-dependent methyltransferase